MKYLGEHKTHQYLVGFAAETQNINAYAQDKLKRKMRMSLFLNNVGDQTIDFNLMIMNSLCILKMDNVLI